MCAVNGVCLLVTLRFRFATLCLSVFEAVWDLEDKV